MKNKFSIVIFGSGSIGKRHYSVIESLPDFDTYILSRDQKRNNKLNDKGYKVFTFNKKCDLAIIATEANEHLKIYKKYINFGKKWLIEKPIFSIYDDYYFNSGLISQPEKVFVGYNKRFELGIIKLKKLLLNRKIIKAHFKCFSNLQNWRKGPINESISLDIDRGGGVINELSHELDLANYLVGPIKKIEGITKQRKFKESKVEDTAYLKIKHLNGINSNVDISFGCKNEIRKSIFIMDDMKIIYNHINGYLIAKDEKSYLEIFKEKYKEERNNSFERQLKSLIFEDYSHARPCTALDGLRYIELTKHLKWQ